MLKHCRILDGFVEWSLWASVHAWADRAMIDLLEESPRQSLSIKVLCNNKLNIANILFGPITQVMIRKTSNGLAQ